MGSGFSLLPISSESPVRAWGGWLSWGKKFSADSACLYSPFDPRNRMWPPAQGQGIAQPFII